MKHCIAVIVLSMFCVGRMLSQPLPSQKIQLIMKSSVISQSIWNHLNFPTRDNLFSVCFADSNTGFVVGGYGLIFKTTDGGNAWINQSVDRTFHLYSVSFWTRDYGFACGTHPLGGPYYEVVVLKTTNGGNNWSVSKIQGFTDAYSICFADSQTLYVAGGFNSECWYAKTNDAGNTWRALRFYDWRPLYSVHFANSNTGFLVGGGDGLFNGRLFTHNGGKSWYYPGSLVFDGILKGVCSVGNSFACAVGNNGIVTTTGDGGVEWSTQTVTSNNLNSVFFSSSSNGYAVGDLGTIIQTSNGGSNWSTQYVGNKTLRAIYFPKDRIGYAVGDSGVILKTTTGITSVSLEGLPTNQFALYQNFPNPFNPSTTIRFSLPISNLVTLKIFDLLGREIETLVNGRLSAGEYHTKWNAADHPSGTYFYRLQVDGFVQSRRLILLK